MVKRGLDLILSLAGLVLCSPVLLLFMFLIWRQDGHNPLYIAPRVGRGGRPFPMVKLRSMVVGADKTKVDSTAADDKRITRVGRLIRRFKLDELSQLWNVLKGDMSLVGPRPNVEREVALYTDEERKLLLVRPGITDFASIVFSDEGDILKGSPDPDLKYHQVIRPWKNRLGLFYVQKHNLVCDLVLIVLTVLAVLSRPLALRGVSLLLARMGADPLLVAVAKRKEPLEPYPPPGASEVVQERPA